MRRANGWKEEGDSRGTIWAACMAFAANIRQNQGWIRGAGGGEGYN
jgi:hypothetical protein